MSKRISSHSVFSKYKDYTFAGLSGLLNNNLDEIERLLLDRDMEVGGIRNEGDDGITSLEAISFDPIMAIIIGYTEVERLRFGGLVLRTMERPETVKDLRELGVYLGFKPVHVDYHPKLMEIIVDGMKSDRKAYEKSKTFSILSGIPHDKVFGILSYIGFLERHRPNIADPFSHALKMFNVDTD